jgi:hypothetical protein
VARGAVGPRSVARPAWAQVLAWILPSPFAGSIGRRSRALYAAPEAADNPFVTISGVAVLGLTRPVGGT